MMENSQFKKEMDAANYKADEFERLRRRGIYILLSNEIIAIAGLIWQYFIKIDWVFYCLIIYFVISTLLLFNRVFKTKPKEQSNYIFGEKLGNKMSKTPQKFIYEAMMMSLTFIILAGIASSIYSIFFTEISFVYKIIIGVSGVFGAIFMLMILITTFIQYKQLIDAQNLTNQFALYQAKTDLMKGGIDEWLKK